MDKLSFWLVTVNVIIFSCSLLLNVFFGGYASYIRLSLIVLLWLFTIAFLSVRYPLSKRHLRLPNNALLGLVFCLTIMLVVSATVSRAPIIANFYSIIPYFSFYPLIYLLLFIRQDRSLVKKLLITFIILCNILALGVIYDGSVGLENTPYISGRFASALQDINTVDATGDRRGGFFFGSATSVYPFMSIGILSVVILDKLFKDIKISLLFYITIPLVWLGCFFTFSRAPLILGTIFAGYAFIEITILNNKIKLNQKIITILLIALVATLSTDVQSFLSKQMGSYHTNRLESTLSANDPGNSHRFSVWGEGLELFGSIEAWRGYGLGTSNIRMAQLYDFDRRPQYESSIFFTLSEGGIAGLIARLMPIFITILASRNSILNRLFLLWSFLFLLNLLASPLINGHPVQLSYFLGMSMCVAFAPLIRKNKEAGRLTKECFYE